MEHLVILIDIEWDLGPVTLSSQRNVLGLPATYIAYLDDDDCGCEDGRVDKATELAEKDIGRKIKTCGYRDCLVIGSQY